MRGRYFLEYNPSSTNITRCKSHHVLGRGLMIQRMILIFIKCFSANQSQLFNTKVKYLFLQHRELYIYYHFQLFFLDFWSDTCLPRYSHRSARFRCIFLLILWLSVTVNYKLSQKVLHQTHLSVSNVFNSGLRLALFAIHV